MTPPPPEPSPPEDGKFEDPARSAEIDLPRVHGSILREPPEPSEGQERMPAWFKFIALALAFWGVNYLVLNAGGFRADVFRPAATVAAPPADPATLGARIYQRNCMICHQFDGRGVPQQYPPLAGSEWVLDGNDHAPHQPTAILLNGLEGPVTVAGNVYSGAMPSWRVLHDDEIAAVLTYVRSSWGNRAPPVTKELVARMRAATSDRNGAWTEGELESLEPPTAEGNSSPAPVGH